MDVALEFAKNYGIFAVLFTALIAWILKDSKDREKTMRADSKEREDKSCILLTKYAEALPKLSGNILALTDKITVNNELSSKMLDRLMDRVLGNAGNLNSIRQEVEENRVNNL